MKCQSLFSGKNKKNYQYISAEFAQRVVKVKHAQFNEDLYCGLLTLLRGLDRHGRFSTIF